MKELNFTYWKNEQFYLGYLNDYPDYLTQGTTKDDLMENLRSLYDDIVSEEVPFIRKTETLKIAGWNERIY